MVWKPRPYSQHLGSLTALRTLSQVKRSSWVASLSAARRAWMKRRSTSVRNLAVSG